MLAVGIDIGGTNTKIGIVTAKDGCLIKRTVFKLLADSNQESSLGESKFNDLEARDAAEAALQNDPVAVEAFRYAGIF